MEGLLKILDFGHFVLIWWQSNKKQEILKHSCKDLVILAELPIAWVNYQIDPIILSTINIKVTGAFAINMIAHNSLTQNLTRLKFWKYSLYVIYSLKDDA